jgi:hypothetical protein
MYCAEAVTPVLSIFSRFLLSSLFFFLSLSLSLSLSFERAPLLRVSSFAQCGYVSLYFLSFLHRFSFTSPQLIVGNATSLFSNGVVRSFGRSRLFPFSFSHSLVIDERMRGKQNSCSVVFNDWLHFDNFI